MVKPEMEIGEQSYLTKELTTLLRLLSKPAALKLLFFAEQGIRNSTHAMEELDITQKIYYARLRALMDADLVKKEDGVYEQTGLGRIMLDRFLPAMGRACKAKNKLELIVRVEGTKIENQIKRIIEAELDIPGFTAISNVKLLGDYEALIVEAIDLSDAAEENVLCASNYLDVRVMESTFRAVERGVKNRLIIGKKGLSSKFNQLRMMLSLTFTKTIINFTSNKVDLKEFVRLVDLPYSFCVVDGCRSIVEVLNPVNERFVVALSIDDRRVAEKLSDIYETLWEAGELHPALKRLNSLKSS